MDKFLPLIALFVLASIHLFANRAAFFGWVWHGRFLSFASGVSFAYVFVDLLPALNASQPILKAAFDGVIPYLDRHSYLIALIGFLFFYGLQTPGGSEEPSKASFWASMTGYALFNLFVGASLADPDNTDIQPLPLFVIALGLHYFVHDHNMEEEHEEDYEYKGRFILTAALFGGWVIGYFSKIPDPVIALVVAFVAGGMLLNVMRYELPKRQRGTYIYFVTGALLYSVILLSGV